MQNGLEPRLDHVEAGVLDVGFFEWGPRSGPPVVLLHGFPYDVHAYWEVAPVLANAGCRVIAPYLRGYGPTRFLRQDTPRSGQQAVLGADLLALLDALALEKPIVAGYDWGGRAACVVAALWPGRCGGLVSCDGYNIQNIAAAAEPNAPEAEQRLWYQFYFNTERGRAGLARNRRALSRLLWKLWSPTWAFDDGVFERSAQAFDNPDFVEVVIHSYRHRQMLAAGDPACEEIEQRLAAQPAITVPTVVLSGDDDGVSLSRWGKDRRAQFTGPFSTFALAGTGHNLPQERPAEFAAACLDLVRLRDAGSNPGAGS